MQIHQLRRSGEPIKCLIESVRPHNFHSGQPSSVPRATAGGEVQVAARTLNEIAYYPFMHHVVLSMKPTRINLGSFNASGTRVSLTRYEMKLRT